MLSSFFYFIYFKCCYNNSRIAESWLRTELEEKKKRKQLEEASGYGAQSSDPNQQSFVRGGGFSAGRMAAYDVIG